jgi:hypothetical protein
MRPTPFPGDVHNHGIAPFPIKLNDPEATMAVIRRHCMPVHATTQPSPIYVTPQRFFQVPRSIPLAVRLLCCGPFGGLALFSKLGLQSALLFGLMYLAIPWLRIL